VGRVIESRVENFPVAKDVVCHGVSPYAIIVSSTPVVPIHRAREARSGRRRHLISQFEDAPMHSQQLVTEQDRRDFGDDLIGLTQRAAYDVVGPALQQLRAENQHLRGMAQRSQRADIERALDARVPDWREVYGDVRFAQWLALPDFYSGAPRSQLMRHAVAVGDVGRVVAFYRGFLAEHGAAGERVPGQRPGTRSPATAKPIYTRQQIAAFYEARRKGEINDANWARQEAEIMAAANQGRIAGAFDLDGNKLTELR
jgi:hypothetical protein